ncbi:polymer-forming cytoskeletal protein [Viridibacterium curvum]|uniref:Cell shape determination protein CcmA n=1 Tax=Viridibacterium curvum TaxID=1101404 RepID=A0ABP9QG73_9RHOO
MFGRKKEPSIDTSTLSSLIASNVEIVGNLSFMDGLHIDGHVRGDVLGKPGSRSLLVLSDRGSITGNVRSHDAVINGVIVGDLEVEHFVELQANARVTGSITYRSLRMDAGASVDGKLSKLGDADGSNVVELPAGNLATA